MHCLHAVKHWWNLTIAQAQAQGHLHKYSCLDPPMNKFGDKIFTGVALK